MPDATIEIVQDRTTYHHGDQVSGSVKVIVASRIKARSVRIKFLGHISTFVPYTETVTRDGQEHKEHRTAYGTQSLIKKKLTLWGSEKRGLFVGNSELDAGEYVFPYTFGALSATGQEGLPSSFEGDKGKVEYLLKATIDRAMKLDFDVHNKLKAHGKLPQATVDAARAHKAVDAEVEQVGLLGIGGKIEATMELVQVGAPGAHLVIPPAAANGGPVIAIVRIDNHASATTIDEIKFKLVRTVKYVAGAHKHDEKHKVLTDKVGVNVLPGWHGFEYRYTLADTPAGLRAKMMGVESIDSKILDVGYVLTAKVSHGPKLKLKLVVLPPEQLAGGSHPAVVGSVEQQIAAQLKGVRGGGPQACFGMMPMPMSVDGANDGVAQMMVPP